MPFIYGVEFEKCVDDACIDFVWIVYKIRAKCGHIQSDRSMRRDKWEVKKYPIQA